MSLESELLYSIPEHLDPFCRCPNVMVVVPEGLEVMVELEICCALLAKLEKRNRKLSCDKSSAKEFVLPSTCSATNQKSN